jgi:hypothetical protein
MFQSLEDQNYIHKNVTSKSFQDKFQYKLVDSDFYEIEIRTVSSTIEKGWAVAITEDLIEVYEKRKLNVAANIVRYFIWHTKKYNSTISQIIEWNKAHNPKFAKYENDLQKYLCLI